MKRSNEVRHCSTCGVNWPAHKVRGVSFKTCPSCAEPTDYATEATPLPDEEAYDLATHFIFDRRYASWDEARPDRRLLPENEPDERVRGIFKRADDLLSSTLAEKAPSAIATS
jgi:hypothetical protein